MANAAAHKTLGKLFSNQIQTEKLTYDFAEDGGATGSIELGTFANKSLVLDAWVHVETACTSGGSATVEIGINDADPNAFMDTTSGAVASLVDDLVHNEAAGQIGLVAAANDTVRLTIGAETLTAGKINVIVSYMNID
jgi:hypothetical protein